MGKNKNRTDEIEKKMAKKENGLKQNRVIEKQKEND